MEPVLYNNSYISPLVFINTPGVNTTAIQNSSARYKNFKNTQFSNTMKKTFSPVFDFNGIPNLGAIPKEITTGGRRIMDFEYVFRMLKIVNKHSNCGCNLNDVVIAGEKRVGLCVSYNLMCRMCDYRMSLSCESPIKERTVNTDIVEGMVSINGNYSSTKELLLKMDLPPLSYATYEKERLKIHSQASSKSKILLKKELETADNILEKTAEQLEGNVAQNFKAVTETKTVSPVSNKSFEQFHMNGFLITDQFEIQEERSNSDYDDRYGGISPKDTELKAPGNKMIAGEERRTAQFDEEHLKISSYEIKEEINDQNLMHSETSSRLEQPLMRNPETATLEISALQSENRIAQNYKADVVSETPLNKSKKFQQVPLNGLLIDQHKVKEGRINTNYSDKGMRLSPKNIKLKAEDGEFNVAEHMTLNTTTIKQEINSNVYDGKLSKTQSSEMDILNNSVEYSDWSKEILCQQKQARGYYDETFVDKELIKLHETSAYQEIQDENDLFEPNFRDIRKICKQSMVVYDNQSKEQLSFKRSRRQESELNINQKHIRLDDNKQKSYRTSVYEEVRDDCTNLSESEFGTMEVMDKVSIVGYDNLCQEELIIP